MSGNAEATTTAIDLNEYNGNHLVFTASVCLAISILSVTLRCYVRIVLTQRFQADDWLMLAGLAVFVMSCAFILTGISTGLGRHNKALSQEKEIQSLKVSWPWECCYNRGSS